MRLQAPTHKKHSKNTSLGGAKLLGEGADSIICARLPANVCAAYKFEAREDAARHAGRGIWRGGRAPCQHQTTSRGRAEPKAGGSRRGGGVLLLVVFFAGITSTLD